MIMISFTTLFQLSLVGAGLVLLNFLGRCVYNLYFHPLAKYPGPKLAAISNHWYAKHWVSGRYPYDIDELHRKYGGVVRTAPNDLSFSTLQSWKDIYGHASKDHTPFLKSSWYDRRGLQPSIISSRDPIEHREMRKSLSHAFSIKALRSQTTVVLHYVDLFISQIEKLGTGEKGINMSEWSNWLTFDIIGDLAFGDSFNAVKQAKSHFWVDVIITSSFIGSLEDIFRRLPTMAVLAPFIISKSLLSARKKHVELTHERVVARMAKENDREDFFSHLLSDKAINISKSFLTAQANTLIVAGSETTATFLAGVFYYLNKRPEQLSRLKKEVRGAFTKSAQIDADSTQNLPYLFAVIEECLRIYPPASFELQRLSPGAVVDGHYIPAGTVVTTAIYTTSRSPAYFYDPENFHSERWLPKDHPFYSPVFASDVLEASKPFSMGPRACLGINLAYMEMRIILSKLVWHFDWELLNKDVDWMRDNRWYLLWKKPNLMVRFWPTVRS